MLSRELLIVDAEIDMTLYDDFIIAVLFLLDCTQIVLIIKLKADQPF